MPSYIDRLLAALDVRPDGASGADPNWAPVYVIARILQHLDRGHQPADGSAVDAFMSRLRELTGYNLPWIQSVEQRLNEFRGRV